MPFLKVVDTKKKVCNCRPECTRIIYELTIELPGGKVVVHEVSEFKYAQLCLYNKIYSLIGKEMTEKDAQLFVMSIEGMSQESFENGLQEGIRARGIEIPLPKDLPPGIKSISDLVNTIMEGIAEKMKDMDPEYPDLDKSDSPHGNFEDINARIAERLKGRRN